MAIFASNGIGILGGTFDPVHVGHLRCALEVKTALRLEQVRLLPARVPVHRAAPQASALQRLELLRLAIEDEPGLSLDSREIERDSPSYMIDTLESLRAELGPDQPLALILGMDAYAGLPSWHRWRELLQRAHLVVVERPGHHPPLPTELQRLQRQHSSNQRQLQTPAGLIFRLKLPLLEISSTRVRQLLAQGDSARYLVPDNAYRLLQRYSWYQTL